MKLRVKCGVGEFDGLTFITCRADAEYDFAVAAADASVLLPDIDGAELNALTMLVALTDAVRDLERVFAKSPS